MKIGVMTFWRSQDNYGQILQCYALQKYLRDMGHDAYLIRYDPRRDYIKTTFTKKIVKAFNPVILYRYLLNIKRIIINKNEKKKHPRNFNDFRNEHIIQSERMYNSYNELIENPPEADIFIVGSDQVWNTFYSPIKRVIRAYLLDFGNSSVKRIAYAASFGKEHLENASIEIFTQLLRKFDYISVREKLGLEICKQCGINNAEWVPDPIMLLNVEEYRILYKDKLLKKLDKPYCFFYYLGNKCDFSIQSVYDWAKSKNIEVVYITGNSQQDNYKKIYATIFEWIYLIEYAEYVITSSYHCSVFSLLFKKKFAVIPLSGRDYGMNSRFASLFELFKIENRFINSDFSMLNKEIDWQSVSAILQNIRNNCTLPNII